MSRLMSLQEPIIMADFRMIRNTLHTLESEYLVDDIADFVKEKGVAI